MNIYIGRSAEKVPVWLYDEEKDTVYPLDPVSNREQSIMEEPASPQSPRAAKKASGALCHCGRPEGHAGRHIGSKRGKKPAAKIPAADPVEQDEDPKPVLSCHICELDHMTRDCPDFGAKIADMRERGMDSLQIAGKLKIRMADVPVE